MFWCAKLLHITIARVHMFHPAFVPSFWCARPKFKMKFIWCQWLMPLGTPLGCHYLQYPLRVSNLIHHWNTLIFFKVNVPSGFTQIQVTLRLTRHCFSRALLAIEKQSFNCIGGVNLPLRSVLLGFLCDEGPPKDLGQRLLIAWTACICAPLGTYFHQLLNLNQLNQVDTVLHVQVRAQPCPRWYSVLHSMLMMLHVATRIQSCKLFDSLSLCQTCWCIDASVIWWLLIIWYVTHISKCPQSGNTQGFNWRTQCWLQTTLSVDWLAMTCAALPTQRFFWKH